MRIARIIFLCFVFLNLSTLYSCSGEDLDDSNKATESIVATDDDNTPPIDPTGSGG